MGTYYKQIGVYKTKKALLEFLDDTRYDSEILAWPHMRSSRIRVGMKDYSKGIGENAVDVFYNLSPEEFIRLVEGLNEVRQISAVEKRRMDFSVAKLGQIVELYKQVQVPKKKIAEMREMIAQFSDSRNEVFAEAGGKLSEVFERLVQDFSAPIEKGSAQAEKLLADAQKEKENALKVREVYNDIKILNYEKYINPDNPAERRITTFRVAYIFGMGLKRSKVTNRHIPLILGTASVILSALWVFATENPGNGKEILAAFFTAVTQGILAAGASVYASQLYIQSKKDK